MTIGTNVGTAHITVRPSLRGWSADVRRQLRQELENARGSGSDDPAGSGSPVRGTRGSAAGRRAGQQFAGGFDREVRTRIGRTLERLPPVEIGAATGPAEQKVRDLTVQLQALTDQRIGVDIDSGAALAQIEAIRTELQRLGLESADIGVQVNLTGAAAQLSALQAEIASIRDVDINADADTTAAVTRLTFLQRLVSRLDGARIRIRDGGSASMLSGLSSRTRLFLGLIATLGPALLPAGAVLVSLAASATAAFTAAGIGITVLLAGVLGAILPVLKAQKELEQKQTAAAAAGKAYAAAQQQVAAASRGVADAQRSAARAAEQGDRAVADAQDRAADAQEALNETRRAATERLASYRDQLRGAALDESGAALSVTAARDALNNALIDAGSSQLDIDQARQAVAEAEFAYDQAQKRGKDLGAEARRAKTAGVEGDAAVASAREALAEATRDVADAEREAARARSDGARQVAAAREQLAQASQSAADAAGENAKAQADLADTMGKLSGPAKVFVDALDRAKAAWREFVAETSGDSFGLAVTVLDMFSAVLPNLVPLFRGAARAVRVLLGDLAKFGSGEEGQSFLDWMTKRAPGAIIGIGRSIGNLLKGLGYLVGALADTDTGFLNMTRRFARWARNLDSNRNLKRFVDYVKRMGPILGDALGSIVGALIAIVTAAAPIGTIVLKAITFIADAIASIDPEILLAVGAALLVVKAGTIAVTAAMALFAFVTSPIGLIVIALVAVVGALIYAYRNVAGFRDLVDRAFNQIRRVVERVVRQYILPALRELGATATDMWKKHIGPAFREIGRVVSNAWKNLIRPALKAMWAYIQHVLIPVVEFLWKRAIKPYMYAAANYIRFVYTRIIRPIFNAFWHFINDVLIPVVKAFWNFGIRPMFTKIGDKVRSVWTSTLRPVFRAMRDFVLKVLAPAFKTGLEAIGAAFDALKRAAAIPIYFLVDTIYNKGIFKVLDAIPGVKVKEADTAGLKKAAGFAKGGPVTGGVRGKDSVPAMLMPGEHVLTTAEVQAAGGHGAVFSMRRSLRIGRGGRGGPDRGTSSGGRIFPLLMPGVVTSTYRNHDGVDINAPGDEGHPFVAAAAGTVSSTGTGRGYGNAVFIRGPYGELVYGHAQTGSLMVRKGDTVRAGTPLGRVGSTGRSSGPHLHFGFPGGTYDQAMNFLAGSKRYGSFDIPAGVIKGIQSPGDRIGGTFGSIAGTAVKFAGALKAIARLTLKAPGWVKKLGSKAMGPWGGLLKTGLHDVGDDFAGYVNKKIPGARLGNVFDRGGLALGTGVMAKRTIRPERVLSPEQTELFERQIASLESMDRGTASLRQLAGHTSSGPMTLDVRKFRILDWDQGIATFEAIALDAAEDVFTEQSNHADRMADLELV